MPNPPDPTPATSHAIARACGLRCASPPVAGPGDATPAPTLAEQRAQVERLRAAEARAYDAYWRDLTCDDEAAFQAWWAARQTLAAARRALAAAEERGA
jgi:hypothetical protein